MMALEALRSKLRSELDMSHATDAVAWGNPRAMTEALRQLRRDLGGSGDGRPADDHLQRALFRFVKETQASSFTDLKYVCYGVTVPVGRGFGRLIDRQQLFDTLLLQVNQYLPRPKQFRRCYQGLLSGYFGFERNLEHPAEADQRWVGLRDYLAHQLVPLKEASEKRGQAPDWLRILHEHRNLLTADPCSRYAHGLVKDDQSELLQMSAGLGISRNSWVWEDAFLAYVELVCSFGDKDFKKYMPAVLDLVNGKGAITLPSALETKATAMTVRRYHQCREHPEHDDLRDTCVEKIGNTWLKQTAWDAVVNDEPTRLMVNSWLKKRLIRDFFELLAQDGAADLARLNYWLKWAPQIKGMWFVLGSDTWLNTSPNYMTMRKRMAGSDRQLRGGGSANNAFVMQIGQLLVIEFGMKGNACYIFAASDFNADLGSGVLSINDLKQKACQARLSHAPAPGWEYKFDQEMRRLMQSIPLSRGGLKNSDDLAVREQGASEVKITSRAVLDSDEFVKLQSVLRWNGVGWKDNRPKGGALWVLIPYERQKPALVPLLERLGFRLVEGKGYYLK